MRCSSSPCTVHRFLKMNDASFSGIDHRENLPPESRSQHRRQPDPGKIGTRYLMKQGSSYPWMNNVLRRRVSLLGTLNIVDSSLSNDGVIVTGGGNFLAQALQRLRKF